MFKISVVGIQLNSGFATEIQTLSPENIGDQTLIDLWDTDNYMVIAMEVEKLDDN